MRNKLLLLSLFFFISSHVTFGQIYSTTANNGQTITTCKGNFQQDGTTPFECSFYGEDLNQTVTFCSGNGGPIRVSFIDWDLEFGYDTLFVYNGPSTSSPLLGFINGENGDIFTPHGPRAYTSTGTCLTFRFKSDEAVSGCGWDAIIGCPPTSCGTNAPAQDFCGSAPQICDLNGYCGNTSGWFTQDNGAIGTTGSSLFCGSIENNSWLSFIASATTATFNITSSGCVVSTSGIQAHVYSTTNCTSFTSKSNCVNQNTGSGTSVLTATALTIGTKYYIMVDGFAGNICDYTVTANTGVQVITLTSNPANATLCNTGTQTATITVNNAPAGTTYSWTPTATIIGATNGPSITVNPTITTTYTCVITLPNGCGIQTENYTITVNQKTNPTFTQRGPYCVGATPGTLPTTSNNSITGTWSPSTISTASAGSTTYTFTPTAGLCANTATMVVVVNPTVTPTFTQRGPYCIGATPGTLLTTSNNNITGTWSPATISTAAQGTTTYTFTPTAGQCATTATMQVTVNPNVTPTFTQLGAYCVGTTPGTLPTSSNNNITGTWSPSTISTASQGTTTYTFTPTAGQCATTATMQVTVNPNVTPTFTQRGPYCVGATPGTLPTTSNNNITGTWSPATISTASQGTTTYTFTPTAGLCATTATMQVTVNPNVTPTFTQRGPYCVGATPGTLPTTSNNNITGTWSPATISTASQGTTTYTFTPTAGLCATTATMQVTVNANITPTFTQLGAYCVGATPGTLPTTSNNNITGTWNPSTISTSSQGTTTYTFTPTAGQCATTATMQVTVNPNVTPTFTQRGPYCVGATPGTLPTTSNNNITGTWNPATISTASQGTTTYTFTPTAGLCATTATMQVVVNPNVTPTFTQLGPYCVGATPGTLPTTSNNNITGTWSPATISTASQGTTTYTFTPTAGLCATTATMQITVNPNVTPTFTQLGPYCVGATPGTLPTTSNNTITGTWSPSTISTASQGTTTYTFTPTAGLCATTATMQVTVNPNITPTFTQRGPYCVGATPGTLPTTSNNNITGTWSPATISTASQGTTTYTFTPTAGQCATTATMQVTVNPNVTPTFSQLGPYCVGVTPGTLPTTSNNNITGTWNPATISTAAQGSTTYTFTPTAGLCATTATMVVVINNNPIPTFTQLGPYCVGATPGTLPTTSNNNITGTWSPATISTATQGTTTYTFTPSVGQCGTTATMQVTVNPNVTPTFSQLGPYCVGATPGTLPTTSNNNIAGTWSPSTISTAAQGSTTYTFTPTAGQCATTATMQVTVNPNVTPTFTQLGPYCVGATPGTLPTTSNNNISGTWSPATISTASQGTTTYTFTPTAGQCATTATMQVVVNNNTTPTFSQLGPYCVGATPGTLPTTSNNNITGTWNPATISTASQGSTTYTFTPTAGQCATTATMQVVVNNNTTPTFTQLGPYCVGATPGTLPTTSNNNITGTWNPATISTASQGTTTYTFTPSGGQCGTSATMQIVVNPNVTPTFTQLGAYCVGATPGTLPTTSNNNIIGTWSPSTISTASQGTTTYTFTPTAGQCATTATMQVTVNTNTTPTFTQLGAYCVGATPGTLPTTSNNNITGTWSPATISTASQGTTTYTFTPTAGLCATTATMQVSVNINVTPTFTQLGPYCVGATPDVLLTTSNNNITGSWSPATISTASQGTTTYTFIPTAGQCAASATMQVSVNANITPTFTQLGPYCVDATPDVLPTTSNNNITGTWNPATISTATPGTTTYSFTPTAGQCATTATMDVTINPIAIFDLELTLCNGDSIIIGSKTFKETGLFSETLTAFNGCDSIVNLDLTVLDPIVTTLNDRFCQGDSITIGDSVYTKTGTYFNTFTSALSCDSLVVLNLVVDTTVETNLSLEICNGDSVTIGNQTFKVTDVYRVVLEGSNTCDSVVVLDLKVRNAIATTNISQSICSGEVFTVGNETFNETGEFTITLESAQGCDSTVLLNLLVNDLPVFDAIADQPTVTVGEQVQLNVTTTESLSYNWTPVDLVSNSAIQNPTAVINESTWFVVTATNGQTRCSFTDSVFVEVEQLECSKKNVFIPNAFTPNGDEINDLFIPRSTILKSMKLIVVDRWGNQVFESNDINIGWDGIYKGQPVTEDSYGYYFVGECSDGVKITIKGNVSLLR